MTQTKGQKARARAKGAENWRKQFCADCDADIRNHNWQQHMNDTGHMLVAFVPAEDRELAEKGFVSDLFK